MNIKKNSLLIISTITMVFSLCACQVSTNDYKKIKNDKPQIIKEPTKIATNSETGRTEYERMVENVLPAISSGNIPVVFNDYYIARLKTGNIHIIDQSGEDSGRTGYEKVLKIGNDYICYEDDIAYTFEYASWQSDTNNIGGLGGVDSAYYVYDSESETIFYKEDSTQEEWKTGVPDFIKESPYIYNVAIPPKNFYDNNEEINYTKYPLDTYYVWNVKTNNVYGPYKENEGSIWVNAQAGYDLYSTSRQHLFFEGMLPVKEDGTYRIVKDSDISETEYKTAIPVGTDCIFVETMQNEKAVVYKTLDNIIYLPNETELATEPNGDTIMLKIDNTWQLWKKKEQ